MAHGDALIFLTNILWVFFLFLFIYLFFVVFFLPSFYKKVRARVIVSKLVGEWGLYALEMVSISRLFFVEFIRSISARFLTFFKYLVDNGLMNTTFCENFILSMSGRGLNINVGSRFLTGSNWGEGLRADLSYNKGRLRVISYFWEFSTNGIKKIAKIRKKYN